MKTSIRIVNLLTVTGGVTLLCMSVWPGFLIGCWLMLAFPLVFALGTTWLIIFLLERRGRRMQHLTDRQLFFAPIVVCITFALLLFYVPRRIAFAMSKGQFQKLVISAPIRASGVPLNRWLGIYHVDEFAADPRGGVYFHIGSDIDALGPDTSTYGFAYQPNSNGSPFGSDGYSIHPLGDDWYWFKIVNDD